MNTTKNNADRDFAAAKKRECEIAAVCAMAVGYTQVDEATCSCGANVQAVECVKRRLAPDEKLQRTAEIFKALSDPTRLKIINALLLSELCVCDLTMLVASSQPVVSHHLKTLRQLKLVRYRRESKSVYYQLDDDHVREMFRQGLLHAEE